jgi:hypothetical protein
MKTELALLSTICLIMAYPHSDGSVSVIPPDQYYETASSDFTNFEGWRISKTKNGIQICTRWILTSQHEKTRQVKGIVTIQATREKIARLITDENQAREWMVFLDELNYFKTIDNPEEWYAYGRINILGKMACFDVVTDNRIQIDTEKNQTLITMNGVPGYLPIKTGVHRITGLYSTWSLKTVSSEMTKIEFMLQSDMKPVIPVWITDPVVARLLISTLEVLRDYSREYATK